MMKTIKLSKICFAIIAASTLGLSGCMTDDTYYQRGSTTTQTTTTQTSQQVTKTAKASEPVQATTPGPKQHAAPTLPVIR